MSWDESFADRYEEWAVDTRDRLHLLYVDVLRLSQRWRLLAAVEPTDEQAHLALIAEMTSRGDQHSALRQFERLEQALRQELGVAPSPAAIRLRDQIAHAAASSGPHSSSPIMIGRIVAPMFSVQPSRSAKSMST